MSILLATALGLSALGAGYGAYKSHQSVKETNKANKALALQNQAFQASEAQKQRDENRYLSNTAYSRAFADMKSVGINPYAMSANGSAPVVSTGTPQGSLAQMQPTNAYMQFSNSLSNLVSSAMHMQAVANREASYNRGYANGYQKAVYYAKK